MVHIENWSIIQMIKTEYDAPETAKLYFAGNVYGHSFFEDGHKIITSRITSFNPEKNSFHPFSGTEYVLGKVDEDYETQYPNAYNRLIRSLE